MGFNGEEERQGEIRQVAWKVEEQLQKSPSSNFLAYQNAEVFLRFLMCCQNKNTKIQINIIFHIYYTSFDIHTLKKKTWRCFLKSPFSLNPKSWNNTCQQLVRFGGKENIYVQNIKTLTAQARAMAGVWGWGVSERWDQRKITVF